MVDDPDDAKRGELPNGDGRELAADPPRDTGARVMNGGWRRVLVGAAGTVLAVSIVGLFSGLVDLRDASRDNRSAIAQVSGSLIEHRGLASHPQQREEMVRLRATVDAFVERIERTDRMIGKIDEKLDRLIELQLRRSSREVPSSIPPEFR